MTSFTVLKRTSAQSIATATFTAVSWSSAIEDSPGAWSSGSPTLVTVPSGITKVEALLYHAWASNTDTGKQRISRLMKNGSSVDYYDEIHGDGGGVCGSKHLTRRLTVAAGDTLSWEIYQNTGAALNFYDATVGYMPYCQFKWIA